MSETVYMVVVNHEEQYSIVPAGDQLGQGLREAGKRGTKEECLTFIEQHALTHRMEEVQAGKMPTIKRRM